MDEIIERIQAAKDNVAMADAFDDWLIGDGIGSTWGHHTN
jgi:hypothetical protein